MAESAVITDGLLAKAKMLAQFLALAWILWVINAALLGKGLNRLGIRPRTIGGLWGVGFAPFLHGSVDHLVGNTTLFLILGSLVLLKGMDNFVIVSITGLLVSGLGTWLLGGDNTNHYGASGVIFSYLGFLLLRGYYDREVMSALISLVVCIFYGSLIWGVLPLPRLEKRLGVSVSWEMHFFGFMGGAMLARFLDAVKASLPAHPF